MQGHYRDQDGARPRHQSGHAEICCPNHGEAASARLFLCASPLCRMQVLVCSHCDRGQIYCAQGCSGKARQSKQREANRRYQQTFRGRRNHAARTARYRARQKKVTYQGSPAHPLDDVLSSDSKVTQEVGIPLGNADSQSAAHRPWVCHWCARSCSDRVRRDFLRRRRVHVEIDRIGRQHDHSP